MAIHRSPLALLALGAATASLAAADAAPANEWPAVARSMAGTVAKRWAASVRDTARLGAEPPGRCRPMAGRYATCPIAIVLMADGATGRRPWRCSATAVVWRGDGRRAGRRTGTRCTAFPRPAAVPEPAAAFGTAVALGANGDIACLPAGAGRVTCAMRYLAANRQRCVGAASVPLRRPWAAVALGPSLCESRA